MTGETRAIEEFFRRRYGREALYLPSGRAALYLAFREWLRPGDRVLVSPVNDDVVLFVVLAAGLVPVLGPVDSHTGNLDPAAIPDADWERLRAVLTTNLYSIPDRMDLLVERCRRHDLVLLEDAAHALDSRCHGRRIGEFGVAAAFSLSKHLGVGGGVLTFSDPGRRRSLVRRVAEEVRHRPLPATIAHWARSGLRNVAASGRTRAWLVRLLDRWFPRPPERDGHRMPYTAALVRQAHRDGGGLHHFDRWVRVDHRDYRTWPPRSTRQASLSSLETFAERRHRWLEGTRKLLALGLTPADISLPADTALFRVPLFVREREKVRAHFAGRGVALDYVYDPPLDLYAPELTERLASPRRAVRWSRDVLPVDPLIADRFLTVLEESAGTSVAPFTVPLRRRLGGSQRPGAVGRPP